MSEADIDTGLRTPLCELLGCELPVVQTAM